MPESKAHLVQATRAITGKQAQFEQVEDDEDDAGLKDGFDWYMNPQDRAKYEQIYQESRDMHGEVACMRHPVQPLPFEKKSFDVQVLMTAVLQSVL